jgi:23S rRNA U2552 (ribose-2'-O)-methylase RlmE/FtsJ
MTAQTFQLFIMKELLTYTNEKIQPYVEHLKNGDFRDRSYYKESQGIYDGYPCPFYHYIACAVRLSKTVDAVDLGADRGMSALFIQSELPKDGMVYSVDIEPKGWQYIKEGMNVKKLVGSSTEPSTLNPYNLSKAKFWLIDSNHTDEHLEKEIILYKDRWTKGTIVMIDDIYDCYGTWEKITYDKFENPHQYIHGGGVGFFIV